MASKTELSDTVISGEYFIGNLSDYSLAMTFDCGQCFRFEPISGDRTRFGGVAYGRYIELEEKNGGIKLYNTTKEDAANIWYKYLGLDKDWESIKADISKRSPALAAAADIAGGIRILKQEPWEALCTFIISQCNNIPRIKGIIKNLCKKYGTPIVTQRGEVFYTFPEPEAIISAGIKALKELKLGYRAEYVYTAALAASEGLVEKVEAAESTAQAQKILCSLRGIGEKVASCALLFGFGRLDAFPVDVWIKRALVRLFPGEKDFSVFGPYAGVAQQYMFYCERYLTGTANDVNRKGCL